MTDHTRRNRPRLMFCPGCGYSFRAPKHAGFTPCERPGCRYPGSCVRITTDYRPKRPARLHPITIWAIDVWRRDLMGGTRMVLRIDDMSENYARIVFKKEMGDKVDAFSPNGDITEWPELIQYVVE